MNYLYGGQIWQRGRQPELPTPPPAAPAEFDQEQAFDWETVVTIVALIHRPDGTRRTQRGINRAAQIRLPARGVELLFTWLVLDAWKMAGLPALHDMIAAGRQPYGCRREYGGIHNTLSRVAVTEATNCDPSTEIIVPAGTILRQSGEPDARVLVWSVAAEAVYGRYAFHMVSQHQPEWDEACDLCIWHTRLSPP